MVLIVVVWDWGVYMKQHSVDQCIKAVCGAQPQQGYASVLSAVLRGVHVQEW